MTSVEDNLSGRGPHWKVTLIAWNFCWFCCWKDEIWHPWKATSKLDQTQQSSQLEPELGTAQPQLVYIFFREHNVMTTCSWRARQRQHKKKHRIIHWEWEWSSIVNYNIYSLYFQLALFCTLSCWKITQLTYHECVYLTLLFNPLKF